MGYYNNVMDYYNDNDRKACAWIRELVKHGLLSDGVVDERSIKELSPAELIQYRRVHLFSGIGGWEYALQLAGWPEDRPVWTGSCPCQPFSQAGKRKAKEDDRHLWPIMRRLISKCRPATVFGEQVASRLGREWLSRVRFDLETLGYAVGCADLCAAGASAPHIRQRLYWVADLPEHRQLQWSEIIGGGIEGIRAEGAGLGSSDNSSIVNLANSDGRQPGDGDLPRSGEHGQQPEDGGVGLGMGNAIGAGPQGLGSGIRGRSDNCPGRESPGSPGDSRDMDFATDAERRTNVDANRIGPGRAAQTSGVTSQSDFWSNFDIVHCTDGKQRRFEPGSFPLANGIPARVGLLRGYGNAIVPQVAAIFIRAFLAAE